MHASIKQNLVNHDIMNDGKRKLSSVKKFTFGNCQKNNKISDGLMLALRGRSGKYQMKYKIFPKGETTFKGKKSLSSVINSGLKDYIAISLRAEHFLDMTHSAEC